MYGLKQIIDNAGYDRIVNDSLKVLRGVVYLTMDDIQFKHENHSWYQLCGSYWVNLQGGVPDYKSEELFDIVIQEAEVANEYRN